MAATRIGSDLLKVNHKSYRFPAPVKASEDIGGNTIVGIDSNGMAVQAVDGGTYQAVAVATEELTGGSSDGDVVAEHGEILRDVILKCEGTGFTDADLGKDVYVEDHKTVNVSDNAGARDLAGEIVEVVSGTEVYVRFA